MIASPVGDTPHIADETEITQSFHPVEPVERVEQVERVERAGPPPPAGPPPGLLDDLWRWLAALALLAVAAFLVWFFAVRGHHGRSRVVPAVVGLQQAAAVHRLTGAGYDVRAIIGPAKRPRGIVVSQAPGGGSRLARGQTVTVHVSNGHPPPAPPATTTAAGTTTGAATTTAPAPTAAVPDVTGQTAAAGAGQVEAAGFVAETDPVQGGGTPGSIVQESPAGGTQAKAGETVTLGVAVGSSRPATQIPNVVGEAGAAARAALLQAKLTVRTAYKHGKTGVVLGETPTGTAPEWTQVTIVVGR